MSKKSLLDRVEIPSPCFADWERMVGSEQIRFCEECNKHVYNLSAMPRGEAEALIASAPKGRLCARLTRDAEGITMTADDQPGVQLLWRRASPIANAVVSAILTMATPGVGAAAQMTAQPSTIASVIDRPETTTDLQGATPALSGTVVFRTGELISGAVLTLINEDTGHIQTATSSSEGVFRFFLPASGLFTLKAGGEGYYQVEANGLRLVNGSEQRSNITLDPVRTTQSMAGGAMLVSMVPLRALYSESDRIVAGRVARSVRIKSGDKETALMRTTLNVSSTLKGDGSETVVNVYHFNFGDGDDTLSEGESLLVFLRHGGTIEGLKSIAGYVPADYLGGIKKLSVSEMDAYVQRINELAQMALKETPSKEDLVEWLVRCAEDPATRQEGAVELASSAASLRASSTDTAQDTDSSEDGEEKESEQPAEAGSAIQLSTEANALDESAAFALLLTLDQKDRLMKALLSTLELAKGDEELIYVVQDFHDLRLLPFLVSRLRRTEDNPPEIAPAVMQVIAELLHDKQIEALAESYRNVPYDDEDEEDEKGEQDNSKTQSAAAGERSTQMRVFLQQVERIMRARNPKPAND